MNISTTLTYIDLLYTARTDKGSENLHKVFKKAEKYIAIPAYKLSKKLINVGIDEGRGFGPTRGKI